MARTRSKYCLAFVSYIFGIIFIASTLPLFILGGIFFYAENSKVLHYRNTTCTVTDVSRTCYDCFSDRKSRKCCMTRWQVIYDDGKRHITAFIEDTKVHYQQNSTYPCWYDMREPRTVQWPKPSIRLGAIFLGCGGLTTILTIISFTLCRYYAKKKQRERERARIRVLAVDRRRHF